MFERQRKTKEPCPVCRLHIERCLCAELPSLDLRTRVSLVVHRTELKRTTNTGALAITALRNSRMLVRGVVGESLDLSTLLDPAYHSVLLYPAEGATTLTEQILRAQGKPLQLIVPDGNWRQAGKVHYRHKELAEIPRVILARPAPQAIGHLRKEHTEFGMATLQAIALALAEIEGEVVGAQMQRLYDLKLERTLAARGHKSVPPKIKLATEK